MEKLSENEEQRREYMLLLATEFKDSAEALMKMWVSADAPEYDVLSNAAYPFDESFDDLWPSLVNWVKTAEKEHREQTEKEKTQSVYRIMVPSKEEGGAWEHPDGFNDTNNRWETVTMAEHIAVEADIHFYLLFKEEVPCV